MAFTAEISQTNKKRIIQTIRELGVWRDTRVEIQSIAAQLNAKLRGWINYYGLYSKRSLRIALVKVEERLVKWLKKKHKAGTRKARAKLNVIRRENPELFYHWRIV